MLFPKITAVISFCSNDWRFLKFCIDGVAPFCEKILITVCDHFFDGSQENYALLEEAFRRFPACTFLAFSFDPKKSYRSFSPLFPDHPDWRHEWHNTGRFISYLYSPKDAEFLFFLDCDEIVDSKAFMLWLSHTEIDDLSAMRFACFNYFRQAQFEAFAQDDFSLLARKSSLRLEFLWDEDERMGLFHQIQGKKKLQVKGLDGSPMIRHFSGVRTKEELLKKLTCWGHHWERDWALLVEEEFSRPFNGQDFIRRYRYHQVPPLIDPLKEEIPCLNAVSLEEHLKGLHRFSNVIIVSERETFKRQLENEFAFLSGNDHQFL